MRDKLNVLYNLPTQQTFLKSMSEANAAASRGQGIDFGSNLKYAIAGLDFAVAYDNGTNPFYDFSNLNAFDIEQGLPAFGVAPYITFMAGFNLAALNSSRRDKLADRFKLFTNFFAVNISQESVVFKNTAWGIHTQMKAIEGASLPLGLFKWGGIDLTMGFRYSSLSLGFRGKKPVDVPGGETSGISYSIIAEPAGKAELNVDSLVLPVNVSTNLRILYALSVYLGVGTDIFLQGSSSSEISLGSDLQLRGEVISTSEQFDANVGDVTLGIADKAPSPLLDAYIFTGIQLTVIPAKLLLHGSTNATFTNASLSLSARIGY